VNGYSFTDRVRAVLQGARVEAATLRHEYVGTEHILLGILRTSDCTAVAIITNLGISSADLQSHVLAMLKPGRAGGDLGPDLPYTSRAKKALELAMTEARELGNSYVGTEHLLLGLLREEKGLAAQALDASGLTIDSAREKALEILRSEPAPRPMQKSSYRNTLVSTQPFLSARLAVLLSILALAVAITALILSLR